MRGIYWFGKKKHGQKDWVTSFSNVKNIVMIFTVLQASKMRRKTIFLIKRINRFVYNIKWLMLYALLFSNKTFTDIKLWPNEGFYGRICVSKIFSASILIRILQHVHCNMIIIVQWIVRSQLEMYGHIRQQNKLPETFLHILRLW